MTDVSVSELVSMVHTAPDDGPRRNEDHTGTVDDIGGVAVPPPPSVDAKTKSSTISKGPRQQKPVDNGRHPPEAVKRPASTRIYRYSPLGVPKPHATARVQRMVERAQREFDQAAQAPPYHSKHGRPAIPTAAAYKSVQMGYQNVEHMGGNGVPEAPPSRIFGQTKRQPQVVDRGTPPQRPPGCRVKTSHDRLIDAEFNRDVSQCLVIHGGRALGLERARCETSGLKALVEKNIQTFETQSDAIKLVCLLIAKKLNQVTEQWVGSE